MPTRALLLCGDEKALAAVTQVLAEMGVAFEHFPEPTAAGKRLTSQRFDLILIDCDDQQQATLAFDCVRQSSINQNSMTLAIVDGKAGVPNAFRLGARLVLTKPLSLEQARGTLRNALAIQRREVDSKVPSGTAAASTQHPAIAKAEESIPAPAAPKLPTRLPTLTPTTPAPADWQQQKPETVAAPLARAAAAGTSAQNQATAEVAPSAAVSPASLGRSHFKKEVASMAPPKLELKTNHSPENDDLLMCELEQELDARRKPSAAAIKARGARRKSSPALLAALALLLIGAGFYAGWTMKPGFRAAVLRDYGKLRQLITRTGTSLQTTASAPKAVPQQVLPQTAAAAKPAKTSAKASRAVPSNTPVAEGFLSAQDKSAQGSEGNDTANNAAASSVLLPTSAAQDSNGDRGPLVVAAELADQHVGHRVAPFYPEPARRKRLEGDVVLRVAVNDDGSVDSVQVLDGDARLVAAAVEAVRQWRYDLYYHNGQPSAFQTEVTVRFALPKKGAR